MASDVKKCTLVERQDCANCWLPSNEPLVQQRLPVGRRPACGSRNGLVFGMRMRRQQLHSRDHGLLLVIVEPILTRLEAGYDRMPCGRRMFGPMLVRGTVTASDVPTLGTAAEMKPPTFRRRQAFHTAIATRLRSRVDSALTLFHFRFSFRFPGWQQYVGKTMSSHQQDLPGTTLLCLCLRLGSFTEWQFPANRDYQLAVSHRLGHELERFPVECGEY